jgi:PAS domain S-box-containing protein
VNREHIMAVLYDMAMIVGGELRLRPLLTRSVQRLLHHTSFPVGLVLLDPSPVQGEAVEARLELAIGDHELAAQAGRVLRLPAALLEGDPVLREDPALLAGLPGVTARYTTFLRLPVERQGVILLLAPRPPKVEPQLAPVFRPVMANLAKAIVLCRDHEAHAAALLAERDAARLGLAKSAETLRAMNEAALDAIVVCDADGKIASWNPAAAKVFGYSPEEVLGRDLHELLVPARYRAEADEGFRRFRETGEGRALGRMWDTEARRKDGTEFPVELSLSAMKLDGKWAAVGILRDIGERRRVEDQLRRSQRLDALGQLAGGIAHDFNNLLVVINGSVELAMAGLPPGDPVHADLEPILLAGARAAALTRQLLAFSRRQTLKPEILSLNEVVGDLETMLRRVIGEDIELRLRLAPDLGNVRADPSQLEQILVNLVVNARDAMPKGGTLVVETSNAVLDEGYARGDGEVKPGAYVVLAVSDVGCGIPRETLDHMFEPFFTTKAPGKGTGLGLSTVYGIVKQSGGHIDVESEVGKGTTFRIFLPRALGEAARVPSQAEPAKVGGSETILVVEDDPGVRRLAERVLNPLGYRVLTAAAPSEALDLCESHPGPIHLLLTDVVMPAMDGGALAERVAALRSGVAVLYMSGYSGAAIARHGGLAAGSRLIQKPFTASELAREVREALDGAAASKQAR